MVFEVSEYYELLALHRAIMEAKFHPDPQNLDVPASPLLAAVCNRLLDSLVAAEQERGRPEKGEEWQRWRTRPRQGRFWQVAVQHASAVRDWSRWSSDEKRKFTADALAPLRAPEA